MAVEFIKRVTDDLDGSEGADTIDFSWRGIPYEIDLSATNAKKYDAQVGVLIAAARRPAGKTHTTRSHTPAKKATGSGLSPEMLQAVRDWANRNGYTVSDRGRVPQEVILAFNQAQAPKERQTAAEKKLIAANGVEQAVV